MTTPWRIIRVHNRLVMSVVLGVVGALILAIGAGLPPITSALIGWDVGIGVYLLRALSAVAAFEIFTVRRRAADQDEGAVVILLLSIAAAVASLGAVIGQLGILRSSADQGLYFALAVVTVAMSWAFVHLIFAFHYAHEFYGEGRDQRRGGLTFPGDDEPDYWDFVYFAFVIGMTFQVSDVQVTSKIMRRLVVGHGIVAFVFDVTIVALTVNIGANLMGS